MTLHTELKSIGTKQLASKILSTVVSHTKDFTVFDVKCEESKVACMVPVLGGTGTFNDLEFLMQLVFTYV